MRAVVIQGPGGLEVLKLEEFEEPVPRPGEVLVRVGASALNRADLLQRRGLYPGAEETYPTIPGLEFAGEVLACDAAEAWRPGDRVMGIARGGAMAQQIAVPQGHCLPVPSNLGLSEAAALPEAFLTAYDALVTQAGLTRGERLLVNAAGSGVGTAALQLGRALGARTVGMSRTEDKRRRLAGWGADATVDPGEDDWLDRVRQVARGGIDVVLDLVGGPLLAAHVDLLAPGGRLVTLGLLGGGTGKVNLLEVMRKRLRLTGSLLRGRSDEEKTLLVRNFGSQAMPWIASGTLRPCIDCVLPWTDVRDAHERMERNATFGKIVLEIG